MKERKLVILILLIVLAAIAFNVAGIVLSQNQAPWALIGTYWVVLCIKTLIEILIWEKE